MALHLMFILSFYLRLMQVARGNILDFDCIDIYKQPAFQHPLLKNHKIQEKFSLGGSNYVKKFRNGQSCPKGTVPILKQRNGTETLHPHTANYRGQHAAVMETISDGSIYRGAQADISIHNLTVQEDQHSKSEIWVENGPPDQLNSIQVGWSVYPRLYGDSSTRFTIYWTADGYKTGCYNTVCPGFIITTQDPSIGSIFGQSSIYGGDKTVIFTPQVFQDGFTGNWGLKVFDDLIGYWPKELFTHLNNGASLVRFGGVTFASSNGISPPMGNGHFPVTDFQKSSSFVHVKIRNSNFETIDIEEKRIQSIVDSQCFDLTYWGYNEVNGVAFSFGGPGGNCGD